MTSQPSDRPTISPALYNRDAQAAVAWLERAFGFRSRLVIPGPDRTIAHSELEFGGDFIMVGSADAARGTRSPLDGAGFAQGVYVVGGDPDAHHARALAAGATITRALGTSRATSGPSGNHRLGTTPQEA